VHGLVGHLDGQAAGVGVGIDHHRRDPQPAARLDDADGDLAPIGDEDLAEHTLFPCGLIVSLDSG
jgi:hypothetical protein